MGSQLAFLGLGGMGQGITKNIVKKGNLDSKPLVIWNRTQSVAESHAHSISNVGDHISGRAGPTVIVAASILEAVAGADIIWSCLSGKNAVEETYEVILAAVEKPTSTSLSTSIQGKLFVDSSTITPEATDALSSRLVACGASFVAMPVFGEHAMATAGILTCLPAGPRASVDRILPFLEGVIARSVVDLGDETPGTASLLKLVGNVLIVQMIESVAEAHVLAEKTGLKAEYLHKVIGYMWPGPFEIYSKRMMSGGYFKDKPIVNIEMAQAVAAHVLELASHSGTDLAAYKVGSKHLDAVKDLIGEGADISGVFGAVRVRSGLNFEK